MRERLQANRDPSLLALYFNLGCYMLITSSRPGTQAANPQGIWCAHLRPHHSIDIWRQSAPVGMGIEHSDPTWANFAMSGPWLCSHIWKHYLYAELFAVRSGTHTVRVTSGTRIQGAIAEGVAAQFTVGGEPSVGSITVQAGKRYKLKVAT